MGGTLVALGDGFQQKTQLFHADCAHRSYQSGIYNDNTCTSLTNHMMLVVGYDTAQGYWQVKNSWGWGWGEEGFARFKMTGGSAG